jgi:hypothetical protein
MKANSKRAAGKLRPIVRRIMVCVPVEIRADRAAVLDEACEDTAKRMCVDRWTHFERGTVTVKSMPGAYWHEQPNTTGQLPAAQKGNR